MRKTILYFLSGCVTSFLVIASYSVDLWSYSSFPSDSIFEPQARKSLGRKLVEQAFNESFAALVEHCPPQGGYLKTCLKSLYLFGRSKSAPEASLWPWWFQTMLRDSVREGNGLWGPQHVLQFTDPNIQMCVFENGGTDLWRRFHCQAINSTFKNLNFMKCYREKDRSHSDNNERVVFLRDPLDRFLSGFLDKCMGQTRQEHCEPIYVFHNKTTGVVNDFLSDKRKLFEIYVDTMPLTWNVHFFPQSLYCGGLYRNFVNYSLVGNMGSDFFQDLGRFGRQYPSLEPWITNIFHNEDKGNATNEGVETKAASHTVEFYTPHTIRRILEYYAIDYVMLDLPIPPWAEQMLAED